jgi:hypothetical protein
MPVTWTQITSSGPAWSPAAAESEDWLDLLSVPLLTESGLRITAENGDFLCAEMVSRPPSPWAAL